MVRMFSQIVYRKRARLTRFIPISATRWAKGRASKSGRSRFYRQDFRFHDLRHTFASWYMMNGGDLYELAKILGHSNIKMTERYAKLAKKHIAKTGSTAREMWRLMEGEQQEQARGTA